jgi:hypothetical protein
MWRKARMNDWIRIGVIVSVVWSIGMALYARQADQQKALDGFSFMYKTCVDQQTTTDEPDNTPCFDKAWRDSRVFDPGWSNVLIPALVPIPIAWLIGYLLLAMWWRMRREIKRRKYKHLRRGGQVKSGA